MGKIKLEGFVCERCRHKWVSRNKDNNKPVVCPSCKSPYWNLPRRKIKKNKKRRKK